MTTTTVSYAIDLEPGVVYPNSHASSTGVKDTSFRSKEWLLRVHVDFVRLDNSVSRETISEACYHGKECPCRQESSWLTYAQLNYEFEQMRMAVTSDKRCAELDRVISTILPEVRSITVTADIRRIYLEPNFREITRVSLPGPRRVGWIAYPETRSVLLLEIQGPRFHDPVPAKTGYASLGPEFQVTPVYPTQRETLRGYRVVLVSPETEMYLTEERIDALRQTEPPVLAGEYAGGWGRAKVLAEFGKAYCVPNPDVEFVLPADLEDWIFAHKDSPYLKVDAIVTYPASDRPKKGERTIETKVSVRTVLLRTPPKQKAVSSGHIVFVPKAKAKEEKKEPTCKQCKKSCKDSEELCDDCLFDAI